MDKEAIRTRNRLALVLLVVGKLFGIAGLIVGGKNRTLGAVLLGIDALLIMVAIAISLRTMKERATEDAGQKELLRQMIKEGTLKQHLRDLEAEMANEETPSQRH